MTPKLSAESEAILAAHLATGLYPDEAAVLETALRHLDAEQKWKDYATAAIDEGVAQSERGKFVSAEELDSLLEKYIHKSVEAGQ